MRVAVLQCCMYSRLGSCCMGVTGNVTNNQHITGDNCTDIHICSFEIVPTRILVECAGMVTHANLKVLFYDATQGKSSVCQLKTPFDVYRLARWQRFYINSYGVVCFQLAHFSLGDREDISRAHVIIIIKSEVSTFPIIIFSVVVCLRCLLHHILSLIAYHSRKTGILFSLLLCSLWWVQIFGYVLACRSCSFVCTLHHLITIIVQTYLWTMNL